MLVGYQKLNYIISNPIKREKSYNQHKPTIKNNKQCPFVHVSKSRTDFRLKKGIERWTNLNTKQYCNNKVLNGKFLLDVSYEALLVKRELSPVRIT